MTLVVVKDIESKWEKVKEFFETHYKHPEDKTKPFVFAKRPSDAQIIDWFRKISILPSELQAQPRPHPNDFPV